MIWRASIGWEWTLIKSILSSKFVMSKSRILPLLCVGRLISWQSSKSNNYCVTQLLWHRRSTSKYDPVYVTKVEITKQVKVHCAIVCWVMVHVINSTKCTIISRSLWHRRYVHYTKWQHLNSLILQIQFQHYRWGQALIRGTIIYCDYYYTTTWEESLSWQKIT